MGRFNLTFKDTKGIKFKENNSTKNKNFTFLKTIYMTIISKSDQEIDSTSN